MGIINIGIYESSISHRVGCTPHSGIQGLLRSTPILVIVDDASIAGVARGIAGGDISYDTEYIFACYMPVILDFHVMTGLSHVHIGFRFLQVGIICSIPFVFPCHGTLFHIARAI